MSRSITLARTWRDGTDVLGGGATTHSAAALAEVLAESIPENSTDLQVDIAFPKATLVVLYMLATADMTIETNNSGTPDDTINLKANAPLIWVAADAYHANPVNNADVTKVYVTNTTAGTLDIRALYDPTP